MLKLNREKVQKKHSSPKKVCYNLVFKSRNLHFSNKKWSNTPMHNISFQYELRPEIPNVYGALDYVNFKETLEKIDELLNQSGSEHKLISQALERYVANNKINPTQF